MRTGILASLALAAVMSAGCSLYTESDPDDKDEVAGALELGTARNQALPLEQADRVGMRFEVEPLSRTWTEFGTPESLPLPAATAVRVDGLIDGKVLELTALYLNVVEGACFVSTGPDCEGSTCFAEIRQSNEGVCSFSLRGLGVDGTRTAGRCYTFSRWHGGTGTTPADQRFRQPHIDETLAARERCDAQIARPPVDDVVPN